MLFQKARVQGEAEHLEPTAYSLAFGGSPNAVFALGRQAPLSRSNWRLCFSVATRLQPVPALGAEGQGRPPARVAGVAAPSPVSLLTLAPLRSRRLRAGPRGASFSSDQLGVHNNLCLSLNSLLFLFLSFSYTLLAEGC